MQIKRCYCERVQITYRLVDDRQAEETIICAGGLGGTHLVWSGLVSGLRDRYRIIIWDYPGLSAAQRIGDEIPVDVPSLTRYQAAVIEAERVKRIHLVGWSLGTQVAVEFARHHLGKISSLVAICGVASYPFASPTDASKGPALGVGPALPDAVGWLSERIDRIEALRAMLRRIEHPTRWAKRLGLVDDLVDDLVFDAVIHEFLALDGPTYRRYVQASAEHDASDLLPHLPFPVLVVAGERDRFLEPSRLQKMAAEIEKAEYFEVRGATHFVLLEYFQLLALKIDDFIKRIPRA